MTVKARAGRFRVDSETATLPAEPNRQNAPSERFEASSSHRIYRLFSQFAILSLAEVICRLISLAVVVQLARTLGREGYGRIEFSFNIVFWLIFVIRDGVELVFCREVARRRRVKPQLTNAFVSLKFLIALGLWAGLTLFARLIFHDPNDVWLVSAYGSLLLTTSLGLDNVFRGREKPGIVAFSLIVRSALYALGVSLWIKTAEDIRYVPLILFASEALGISIVWARYSLEFGLPRPSYRHARRFGMAVLAQGRNVLGIQLAQVVLASIDVMIIGLIDSWALVGLYGAPHRIISAALTFGLIFQQVLLPHLVRSGSAGKRHSAAGIRKITIWAMMAMVPMTLVISLCGRWVIDTLFTLEFDNAWPLLTIGVWRVPLLAINSIHIATLVATHREREGFKILAWCILLAVPVVLAMHAWRGLVGTMCAMVFVAFMIAVLTGNAVYGLARQTSDTSLLSPGSKSSSYRPAFAVALAFALLVSALNRFQPNQLSADNPESKATEIIGLKNDSEKQKSDDNRQISR